MLSVIVDARRAPQGLGALLAQLTAGAVDGLVREVAIVAPPGDLIAAICAETGAEPHDCLGAAAGAAKAELVMVLPAALRLRDGWLTSLGGFLAGGGRAARVAGLARGLRAPAGVLIAREKALKAADLQALRRQLGLRSPRVG